MKVDIPKNWENVKTEQAAVDDEEQAIEKHDLELHPKKKLNSSSSFIENEEYDYGRFTSSAFTEEEAESRVALAELHRTMMSIVREHNISLDEARRASPEDHNRIVTKFIVDTFVGNDGKLCSPYVVHHASCMNVITGRRNHTDTKMLTLRGSS